MGSQEYSCLIREVWRADVLVHTQAGGDGVSTEVGAEVGCERFQLYPRSVTAL